MQICPQILGFTMSTEDNVLLNEAYTSDDANGNYANRENLGWRILNGTYPAISYSNGMKMYQTAEGAKYVDSNFRREFTVFEDGNDEYMKIRRVNFKGIYDIELNLTTQYDGNYRRSIIFNGGVDSEIKQIFRYGDSSSNGFYKSFDKRWSDVTQTTGADKNATYRTRLDFINDTVQLFYNGNENPSNYTGSDKVVTSSGDAAPMTTGSDYLSSIDFNFNYRTLKGITVKSVKLIEIERKADATDLAVEMLSTSMITSKPYSVEEPLNKLPDSEDLGLSDSVEIEWLSSNPDVISHDGQVVTQQAYDTDVTITAKITNKEDGFTQYVDFNLTVPKKMTDAVKVYDLLDYSLLTAEKPGEITMDINLPTSIDNYDAQIEWSSNNDAVVVDSINGKGKVNRPSGRKNTDVKLTATITDEYICTTKEFDFTILTSFVLPEPKLLIYEVYKDANLDDLDKSQIANFGWSVDESYKSDGTISHSNATGISIIKTKAVDTSGSGDGFVANKNLVSVLENYNDDCNMSVRQEAYKGIYELELGLNMPYISSGYYRWIALNGNLSTGAAAILTSYRIDYRFAINKSANPIFDNTNKNSGFFGTFALKTKLNTIEDNFQTFHSNSSEPMTVTKTDGIFDTFDLAANSEVFDSINFAIDQRIPNSGNQNRICVEYIKLTEIDRVEDVTDVVLKKLGTNLLTDTPDNVTSQLKTLPTAESLGVDDIVSIEWSSSDTEYISNDGQSVNRGLYNEDIVMTAKITSLADGFTQYADFNLTVKGTSSLADIFSVIDYSSLTNEDPSSITSDLTLPQGDDSVSIIWESDDPAITIDSINGVGKVKRPAGRANKYVTLKATVSDGIKTLEKTFNFTVLTTYITPEPSVIKTWSFADKTVAELQLEGLDIVSENADVYVNDDGNLVVKKISDKSTSNSASRTEVVQLPVRLFDETENSRIKIYTPTHRGKYIIDYTLKLSDFDGTADDMGLMFMNINGIKERTSNPFAANLMFGYGKVQSYIPTSPLYTTDADYRFSPSPSPLNKFLNKWMLVRFEIDMFETSENQVNISYALGGENTKPNADSQFVNFENPQTGIPFATSSGKGLVKLDSLTNPGLGFYEQAPKGANIELAELKIIEIERDPDLLLDNHDNVLSQITMDNITDTPESFNKLKTDLPTAVVSNGRSYKVEWASSSPDLVSNSGKYLAKAEDEGKDVYLTATMKYESYSKCKEFRLTLGSPADDTKSVPSVKDVSLNGKATVGQTLTVKYEYVDATSTGDNSVIKWQSAYDSEYYDIQGVNGKSYTVRSEDAGKKIRAYIIPQNGLGEIGTVVYTNSVSIPKSNQTSGGSSGSSKGSSSVPMVNYAPNESDTQDDSVFADVSKLHWASSAIETTYSLGIISGMSNGTFCPGDMVTREQFAKLVSLTFDISDYDTNTAFADVSETDWSYSYISALHKNEIIQGYDGMFNKSANITRQDMALILYRAMAKTGLKLSYGNHLVFNDADNISEYAHEAVNALSSAGIINGYENKFRPTDFCTRAEAAKLIYEVCRLRGVCK